MPIRALFFEKIVRIANIWGLRFQTPAGIQRLGGSSPDPRKITNTYCEKKFLNLHNFNNYKISVLTSKILSTLVSPLFVIVSLHFCWSGNVTEQSKCCGLSTAAFIINTVACLHDQNKSGFFGGPAFFPANQGFLNTF